MLFACGVPVWFVFVSLCFGALQNVSEWRHFGEGQNVEGLDLKDGVGEKPQPIGFSFKYYSIRILLPN